MRNRELVADSWSMIRKGALTNGHCAESNGCSEHSGVRLQKAAGWELHPMRWWTPIVTASVHDKRVVGRNLRGTNETDSG